MVRALTLVLAGVLIYTVLAMALRAGGILPRSVRVYGPLTTVHTGRGRAFLDWLAGPRRLWRAWGNFGIGITLVVMVGSFLAVIAAAYTVVTQPQRTAITQPQNVLVIPGVNEFLPLSAAPEIVLGLLIGLVVHEGGHGLLCRVEDIDIESMGVALLTIVPVGAFVEPDEASRSLADRGGQTRMFAAGVTNNFAIALVAFVLLFGPVAGSIAPVDGAPVGDVAPGSSAAEAGIERGDVVTAVDDTAVTDADALDDALANASGETVRVTRANAAPVTVQRRLLVTRAVPTVLEGIDLSGPPPVVERVNGTAVHTEAGFRDALANRTVVRLETDRGTATFVAGAYVSRVIPDGPLASAGVPADSSVIVTRIGDERIVDHEDLDATLASTRPGETVEVVVWRDGTRRTVPVTLDESPDGGDGGFLGVQIHPGVSGTTVDDFGVDVYPAGQYLGLLGGGGDDPFAGIGVGAFFQRIFLVLFLPFASAVDPTLTYNFAGFVGPVTNFYQPAGPLAGLGGWVFTLANVLFWAGWVNLQLGFFNCIPAYPLDGGHILRTCTEAVVSRLPVREGRSVTTAVTTAISVAMLAGVLLMVFGAQLFG